MVSAFLDFGLSGVEILNYLVNLFTENCCDDSVSWWVRSDDKEDPHFWGSTLRNWRTLLTLIAIHLHIYQPIMSVVNLVVALSTTYWYVGLIVLYTLWRILWLGMPGGYFEDSFLGRRIVRPIIGESYDKHYFSYARANAKRGHFIRKYFPKLWRKIKKSKKNDKTTKKD